VIRTLIHGIKRITTRVMHKVSYALIKLGFSREKYIINRPDLIALNLNDDELILHALSFGHVDNRRYFYKDPISIFALIIIKINSTKNRKKVLHQSWQTYRYLFWKIRKILVTVLLLLHFVKSDYLFNRLDLKKLNRLDLVKHAIEFGHLENYSYFNQNKMRRFQRTILLSNEFTLIRYLIKNETIYRQIELLNNKFGIRNFIQQQNFTRTTFSDLSFFDRFFKTSNFKRSRFGGTSGECLHQNGKSLHSVTISVIMPVFQPDPKFLFEALLSLTNQNCVAFETIIVLDGPQPEPVSLIVNDFQKTMNNVCILMLDKNSGVSTATNEGIKLSKSDYLLFLDHDDLFAPNAVEELRKAVYKTPNVDLVYSDHDKINEEGAIFSPEFKPDYSPTLALSYMYIGHMKAYKRSLFEHFGVFDSSFDGCQDYEWFLRNIQEIKSVVHVSKILYHYRVWHGSTTQTTDQNPKILVNTRRAVQNCLDKYGLNGEVRQATFAPNIGICEITWAKMNCDVTILIPSISIKLIEDCISTLLQTDLPLNVSILVIDNTDNGIVKRFIEQKYQDGNIKCEWISKKDLGIHKGWSFSKLMNRSVNLVNSKYVLLLNDDVRPKSKNWLTQMLGYIQLPSVGIVGAKLIFPNGNVQHNGIRLGNFNGLAAPIFRGMQSNANGYLDWNLISREVDAVTAACLLISVDLWRVLGGMNEENLNVSYNDVDLCLRAQSKGFSSVVCTSALLVHFEGATRNKYDDPTEEIFFKNNYLGKASKYTSLNFVMDNHNWLIPKNLTSCLQKNSPLLASNLKWGVWSHNLNLEGATKSLEILTNFLAHKGYCIELFAAKDGPLRANYEALGVFPKIIQNYSSYDPEEFYSKIVNLSDILRHSEIDGLIVNTSIGIEWVLAAKYAQIPTVWIIRESEQPSDQFKFAPDWYIHLWDKVIDQVDKVVFVSYSSLDQFRSKLSRGNFEIIQNGYQKEVLTKTRQVPCAKKKVKFISVGTISERKNQIDSLNAFTLAFSDAKNAASIQFIGNANSDYGEEFKRIVQSHIEKGYDIEIISSTSEIHDYYSKADVLVTTSLSESFPRVFLEALSHSLICIGYPVNGLKEQMRHGWDSFCVNPRDIQELAHYMRLIYEDHELLFGMQNNTRVSLETFDDTNVNGEKYEKLLITLIENS
jgi:GT2 family glycosyltransferase/glycosyltransferase involved in cell wall biosynthesis